MKFIILFMVIAALNATAEIYSQYAKVTLDINNGTIHEVFSEIEKQSDFNIFYNVDQIDIDKKISINVHEQLLSEVLTDVLSQSNLSYTVLDKTIVIRGNAGGGSSAQDQSTLISGNVLDSKTSEPLPGVNIIIKGTNIGTISDVDGNFSLKSDEGEVTLTVSFVGYTSAEVQANGNAPAQIMLEPDVLGLEEVVVVGYGIQKKSLVTGSISSVKSEDLENSSISMAEQALQGRTAGVHVVPASGSPGSGIKVRIRGTGSNGNAQPLYIVDGIKTRDISTINPNDIESMEVLKDAASSAIYGAEGANGVVMITTKSGKVGKSEITYNFQYGIQSPAFLPEMMNAEQYIDFMNDTIIPGVKASGYNTDWMDVMTDNAPMQKHDLSFRGGNETTTFFSALSYLDQDGIIAKDKSNYKRISGRLNVDHKVNKLIKVGSKIAYTHTDRGFIPEDHEFNGLIAGALGIDPLTPVYYDDTLSMPLSVRDNIRGQPARKTEDGRYFGISQYVQGELVNPKLREDLVRGSAKSDNILGNFYMNVSPIKGLTLTSRVGLDYTHQNNHFWDPTYYYSSERNRSTTSVTDDGYTENSWQWENFFTYERSISQSNLAIVGGMSAEALTRRILIAQKSNMFIEDDLFDELNYTADAQGTMEGNVFEENIVSYFGRASYNYMNKYLLQASLRFDGASTSLLPPDNNWGIFPSFSAGWVLSEESFFPSDLIPYMKIRGSWGRNGSLANLRGIWKKYTDYSPFQGMSNFAWMDYITNEYIKYPMADGTYLTAAEPANLSNPDLTWEKSEQMDIGADLRFFDGKLSLTLDYYNKKTKDLLCIIENAAIMGIDKSFVNAGEIENKGFETEIGIRNSAGDFNYEVNLNMSTLKNEVLSLNTAGNRLDGMRVGTGWTGATTFEKGEPIWYFRGFESKTDEKGNISFVDQDGDKDVDEDDLTNIGSPHPKLIYGGNIFLEYKGIDMNILVQGVYGNSIILGWIRSDRTSSNKPTEFYNNKEMRKHGDDQDGKLYRSDQLVFDGSYTRIKQLQIGYTLPGSLTNQINLSNFRLYISLEDYFTFSKYIGMDPEAGSDEDSSIGVDKGTYPIPKKVLFGFTLSF